MSNNVTKINPVGLPFSETDAKTVRANIKDVKRNQTKAAPKPTANVVKPATPAAQTTITYNPEVPKPAETKAEPTKAQPTPSDLLAEIARLQAENERLSAKAKVGTVSIKLSEKGAMSIYGMGQFPFTFYRSQWEKFTENLPAIQAWFEENKDKLTVKTKTAK